MYHFNITASCFASNDLPVDMVRQQRQVEQQHDPEASEQEQQGEESVDSVFRQHKLKDIVILIKMS